MHFFSFSGPHSKIFDSEPENDDFHPKAIGPTHGLRDTEILVNSGVRSPVTDFLSRCNPLAKTSFTTCGVYSQWPFLISRETVR